MHFVSLLTDIFNLYLFFPNNFGFDSLNLVCIFANKYILPLFRSWLWGGWHGYIDNNELACFQRFYLDRGNPLLETHYLFKQLTFLSQVLSLRTLKNELFKIVVSISNLGSLDFFCILIIVKSMTIIMLFLLLRLSSNSLIPSLLLSRNYFHRRWPERVHLLELFIPFGNFSHFCIFILIKLNSIFTFSIR